jgi:predicted KAP-like P-loop ATPase
LDIREDVYTLSAVMLSREVKPPLAIGLFGAWGTGKSFFMQSMRKACEVLRTKPKFRQNIVSIEFNAWHYVEANLWASMVSHILERLATQVSPAETQEQKEAALTAELSSAKAIVEEATGEKKRTQALIQNRAA